MKNRNVQEVDKMRVYYEIIKISIKNSVVYKLDTLISIFGSIITLYVQIYLWKALFNGNSIDVVSLSDMITYQIVGVVLGLIYMNTVALEVGNKVRDGSIAIELIRPYNFAISMFFKELGNTISGFVIKGLPVIIFAIVVFNFRLKTSLVDLLLLLIIFILNILIYWLMHYIIGLLHFIFINAVWFIRILGDTIRILGGGVIPLWFFPDILRKISLFLPFQLLYQLPQSIFINKISANELITGIITELAWISVLGLLSLYLWSIGTKKLVIQGG